MHPLIILIASSVLAGSAQAGELLGVELCSSGGARSSDLLRWILDTTLQERFVCARSNEPFSAEMLPRMHTFGAATVSVVETANRPEDSKAKPTLRTDAERILARTRENVLASGYTLLQGPELRELSSERLKRLSPAQRKLAASMRCTEKTYEVCVRIEQTTPLLVSEAGIEYLAAREKRPLRRLTPKPIVRAKASPQGTQSQESETTTPADSLKPAQATPVR